MPAPRKGRRSLRSRGRRLALHAVALAGIAPAVVGTSGLVHPDTASASRDIPVAAANVNDQKLKGSNLRWAVRFVLDQDATVYRFFTGFKALGAGGVFADQGTGSYGRGDAGTINAQLVTVKADGTPDLGHVLGQETVTSQQRYKETKANYGISTVTGQVYYNFGGVPLKGGTMYAVVIKNVTSNPATNYFSVNSPVMKESEAGPNGYNNLDPSKPGAVGGLDPREAVAWSQDAGSSWVWGRLAGLGDYAGSATTDDGTRLPWYGWTTEAGNAHPHSVQPYYQYWQKCSGCTLTLHGAPRAVTLTKAGGYAPVGANVGTVTVKNLRTGQTGRTGSLGTGVEQGALDTPVRIEKDDTYTIAASGTVYKNPADNFIRQLYRVGANDSEFPFTTNGTADRAEVFATPHPWFRDTSGTPAPARQPAPQPTPVPAPQLAPVASWTTSAAPVINAPTTLDASASTGTRLTCAWDLDGATKLAGCKTEFTFRYAGTKRIALTVKDSAGRTATAAKDIVVGAATVATAPVARWTASPSTLRIGAPVTLDASASTGRGLTCAWDLDGATKLTGCKTRFTFRYAGTKHVTLTVKDSAGRTARAARDLSLVKYP